MKAVVSSPSSPQTCRGLLTLAACLFFFGNIARSFASPLPNTSRILNTTRIFSLPPLSATLSPNVSRDAPYILQLPPFQGSKLYQPVWVFSDTETSDPQGNQFGFVSNSAGWDTSDRLGILSAIASDVSPDIPLRVADMAVSPDGVIQNQWIPFTNEEAAFNEANGKGRNGSTKRLALCGLTLECQGPNCTPTPLNQTHAFLYCTIIEVMSPPTGSEGQDAGWKYSFKGITLVSITVEAAQVQGGVPQGILAAHRTVPELFTENDLSWGNFDTLVGDCPAQGGVSQNHSCACPVAIGARGLMLACVPLAEMDKKEHYTYYDPPSSSFLSLPPIHTSVTAPFLNGTFSSGNIFFSDMYQTFLIIYFNRLVDNSFYIRFLDKQKPLHILRGTVHHSDKDWAANKALTPRDVVAIVKYAWSPQYKLYETEQGKGGFSYAGSVAPQFFSGIEKTDEEEKSWVLLTWTEQTGEKVAYRTRGSVVGFLKQWVTIHNNQSDTMADTSAKGEEGEEEGSSVDKTRQYLPWDEIYTRGNVNNVSGGASAPAYIGCWKIVVILFYFGVIQLGVGEVLNIAGVMFCN